MEFIEIQEKLHTVKSPDLITNNVSTMKQTTESFIEKLKKQDIKDRRFAKGTLRMFYIYIVFMFLLFIVNPDPDLVLYHRIGGASLFTAVLIFAILLRKRYLASKNRSYDIDTLSFFEETEERLVFKIENPWIFVSALILICIGENLFVINRYWNPEWGTVNGVIFVTSLYFLLLFFGFLFARRSWKKDKEPLYKIIKNLKTEFTK